MFRFRTNILSITCYFKHEGGGILLSYKILMSNQVYSANHFLECCRRICQKKVYFIILPWWWPPGLSCKSSLSSAVLWQCSIPGPQGVSKCDRMKADMPVRSYKDLMQYRYLICTSIFNEHNVHWNSLLYSQKLISKSLFFNKHWPPTN